MMKWVISLLAVYSMAFHSVRSHNLFPSIDSKMRKWVLILKGTVRGRGDSNFRTSIVIPPEDIHRDKSGTGWDRAINQMR